MIEVQPGGGDKHPLALSHAFLVVIACAAAIHSRANQ
jgi:hypothetical protein